MLGPYPGPYYDSNAKDYTHEFLFGDDSASNGMPAMGNRPAGFASEVFVVHGHDDALRIEVCRLVERLGLKPVVLFEQADKGQTIIEKFEEHSNVGYAIVLITPDDEGRLRDEGGLAPRARQNVIFELGFFYGRLGREKVCAVVKQGVEFPSDILGVIHKVADPAGAWNLQVAREMKSAGLNIDLNRLG
jgi:predicted nucleotide-binding protein